MMPSEIQKIETLPPAVLMHVEDMPVLKTGDNKQRRNDRSPEKMDRPRIDRVVEELNSIMQRSETNLVFSVDDASGHIVIRVVNSATQEIIRQIPPEETLRIASHISKLMGILVDESA